VHDRVEVPEAFVDGVEQRGHRRLVGDVGRERRPGAPVYLDLADRGVGQVDIAAVGDGDVVSVGGQPGGDNPPGPMPPVPPVTNAVRVSVISGVPFPLVASRGAQLRPAVMPPSTSQMAPVTQLVAGESRKVMVLAMSRTVPVRPSGWKASKLCRVASIWSFGTNLS
jgi:hypothetical protein